MIPGVSMLTTAGISFCRTDQLWDVNELVACSSDIVMIVIVGQDIYGWSSPQVAPDSVFDLSPKSGWVAYGIFHVSPKGQALSSDTGYCFSAMYREQSVIRYATI
ncbi:hypothetical protein AXG93_857s1480 [Marchantia polymorpha subsp. ruderalis]|uniref:Uncharacterized protein n=1 Tax=Marchantia polymorpha subsp. ruderalis TaxID=1480154 RepID=A0A176WDX2_MARPO|nr:hypothetical protein AXG93_857s1480 [Marchantia polymorpha subsp. ruderalis]